MTRNPHPRRAPAARVAPLVSAIALAACSGGVADQVVPAGPAAHPAALQRAPSAKIAAAADVAEHGASAAKGFGAQGAKGDPEPRVSKEEPSGDPAAPAPAPPGPRMGAVLPFAYIYKKPAAKGLPLGYIRFGQSVPLLSDEPVHGEACGRGWYRVAPRGFACLNRKTTLDLSDPYFVALSRVAPDPDAVWPYRYAFSNGAPMYSRIPTPEEQDAAERRFGPRGSYVRLAEWSRGHEELLTTEPIEATDPVPEDVFQGNRRIVGCGNRNPKRLVWRVIPNGSMVAYASAFAAEGRVWLLTSDLMIVPADRVRAVKRSMFQGVRLGKGVDLPLAWNRAHGPKPKFVRAEDGTFTPAGTVPGKRPVAIRGERIASGKKGYYELRDEPGVFVDEADMTFTWQRATLPRGVPPGGKWIEAKILPGTLTAYEGTRPVYATLFSPGKGGVPVPGHDHTKWATTAVGFFPVEWKDRNATMSNEKNGEPKILWFSEVPHIQYLRAPLAMHVAYWHEDFGNPKSAECVNVSALDGHFLFNWTEPRLPEGWGGMRPGGGNGKSTPVIVSGR